MTTKNAKVTTGEKLDEVARQIEEKEAELATANDIYREYLIRAIEQLKNEYAAILDAPAH